MVQSAKATTVRRGPYARSRDLRLVVGAWVAVVLIIIICII